MSKHALAVVVVAALTLLSLSLAACSAGGGIDLDQRASSFVGGALSNFSGTDGDEPEARATARDVAIAREFDFTPVGFTIAAGAASTSLAGASSRFGDGLGTTTVNGDTATVDLDITALDPNVTNMNLSGTYSVTDAQTAVANAGNSFTITWLFQFSEGITTYSIEADQVLSGTNWIDV
jgi:hypothetical protein